MKFEQRFELNAASSGDPRRAKDYFLDYTIVLWGLKLGGLINLYFPGAHASALRRPGYLHRPACANFLCRVRLPVSFPVRYEHNVVFRDSIFSSIFVTRLFATFSEIAYIFLFSYVLRLLNIDHVEWVIALSWLMLTVVVISEGFVWAAILTEQLKLYYYEELGWALIFVANTIASAYLYLTVSALGDREALLKLNLLFGIV